MIVGGLELATLVFMNLEEDEEGDVEIKGVKYSEMPLKLLTQDTDWNVFAGLLRAHLLFTKRFTQKALLG